MAVGLHAVNLANPWLNLLRNVSFAEKANVYAQLHTGDPGAAGTSNASAETDRAAITFNAAGSGAMTLTGTGTQWGPWDQGTETISHISVWDASSTGNFLYSFQLSIAEEVNDGDTATLTAHSISLTPLAA